MNDAGVAPAHRARSEAVHAYLKRVAGCIRRMFSPDDVRVTVPVRRETR